MILVGYSYGGMAITGVADRIPEKIGALVYRDALIPENGDSLFALLAKSHDPETAAQMRVGFLAMAMANGGLVSPIRRQFPFQRTQRGTK